MQKLRRRDKGEVVSGVSTGKRDKHVRMGSGESLCNCDVISGWDPNRFIEVKCSRNFNSSKYPLHHAEIWCEMLSSVKFNEVK